MHYAFLVSCPKDVAELLYSFMLAWPSIHSRPRLLRRKSILLLQSEFLEHPKYNLYNVYISFMIHRDTNRVIKRTIDILRHTLRDKLLAIARETSSLHTVFFQPGRDAVGHSCRSFPKPSASHLDPHHPCRSTVGKTLSGPFGSC